MAIHEQSMVKMGPRNRKTKMEILETIKNFIESQDPIVFNKSALIDNPWKLDPRTADEFLEIAYYCQNFFPPIRISLKDGKKIFQPMDYQELKREMKNLTLKSISSKEDSFDLFNPKIFPVFKCRKCGNELGYPSHHNEPMKYSKASGKLICTFRECNFSQPIPEHHKQRMEIFVKYSNKDIQNQGEYLIE